MRRRATSQSRIRPTARDPASRRSMYHVNATSRASATNPEMAAVAISCGEVVPPRTSHSTATAGTTSLPSVSQMLVTRAQRRKAAVLKPHVLHVE